VTDIVQRAKDKRVRLLAELKKLEQWIEMAEDLGEDPMSAAYNSHPVPERLSKREQVTRFCRDLLSKRGAMSLSQIFDEIQKAGIDPGTSNPKGMLSIILSRSDEFESDREAGGWKLKK